MLLPIIRSKVSVVIISLVISIILIEIILTYFTSYNYTSNTGYEKNRNTIITRKKATYIKSFHPDLSYKFFNYYDIDHIKNSDQLNTKQKKNQLAFFGDSFVEARLVEEVFSFTKILDNLTKKNYNVINYGLDSFGVEQSFQRYRDYIKNDIKHVFYVFCANDIDDLDLELYNHEKLLNNILEIRRQPNLLKFYLGKFNLPNFLNHSFNNMQYLYKKNLNKNYKSEFMVYNNKNIDNTKISNKINPEKKLIFNKLLKIWSLQAKTNNHLFTIIVLPRNEDSEVFDFYFDYNQNRDIDILKLTHNDKKLTFKNDGHLNEYGNLIVSIQITNYLINKKYLEKNDYLYDKYFFNIKTKIDTLYNKHK